MTFDIKGNPYDRRVDYGVQKSIMNDDIEGKKMIDDVHRGLSDSDLTFS